MPYGEDALVIGDSLSDVYITNGDPIYVAVTTLASSATVSLEFSFERVRWVLVSDSITKVGIYKYDVPPGLFIRLKPSSPTTTAKIYGMR